MSRMLAFFGFGRRQEASGMRDHDSDLYDEERSLLKQQRATARGMSLHDPAISHENVRDIESGYESAEEDYSQLPVVPTNRALRNIGNSLMETEEELQVMGPVVQQTRYDPPTFEEIFGPPLAPFQPPPLPLPPSSSTDEIRVAIDQLEHQCPPVQSDLIMRLRVERRADAADVGAPSPLSFGSPTAESASGDGGSVGEWTKSGHSETTSSNTSQPMTQTERNRAARARRRANKIANLVHDGSQSQMSSTASGSDLPEENPPAQPEIPRSRARLLGYAAGKQWVAMNGPKASQCQTDTDTPSSSIGSQCIQVEEIGLQADILATSSQTAQTTVLEEASVTTMEQQFLLVSADGQLLASTAQCGIAEHVGQPPGNDKDGNPRCAYCSGKKAFGIIDVVVERLEPPGEQAYATLSTVFDHWNQFVKALGFSHVPATEWASGAPLYKLFLVFMTLNTSDLKLVVDTHTMLCQGMANVPQVYAYTTYIDLMKAFERRMSAPFALFISSRPEFWQQWCILLSNIAENRKRARDFFAISAPIQAHNAQLNEMRKSMTEDLHVVQVRHWDVLTHPLNLGCNAILGLFGLTLLFVLSVVAFHFGLPFGWSLFLCFVGLLVALLPALCVNWCCGPLANFLKKTIPSMRQYKMINTFTGTHVGLNPMVNDPCTVFGEGINVAMNAVPQTDIGFLPVPLSRALSSYI